MGDLVALLQRWHSSHSDCENWDAVEQVRLARDTQAALAAVPVLRWTEIQSPTHSEALAVIGPWTLSAALARLSDSVVYGWDLYLDTGGESPVLVRTITVPDASPDSPPTLADLEAGAVAALRSLGVAFRVEVAT